MSVDDCMNILDKGSVHWNSWRDENLNDTPDLRNIDLSGRNLSKINLSGLDLSGSDLFETDLSGANLKMCILKGADLSGANLDGAALYKSDLTNSTLPEASLIDADLSEAIIHGADLRNAKLSSANLSSANLSGANLRDSDLSEANLSKTIVLNSNFSNANFSDANVFEMEYGATLEMRGNYLGVRGLDSCYRNALFVRDAKDQDFLDNLEDAINRKPSAIARNISRFWFKAWAAIDYGRNLLRTFLYALLLICLFGLFYKIDLLMGWGLIDYSSSAQSWFSPFYYSIVTYSTLGFGDITPKHWIGEIVVVVEVILGYVTLGLLLSILANKVARRS